MKRETFDGGWLELREPHEITVKHRRGLNALLGSLGEPMFRVQEARDVELAKLGLSDDQEPTPEQVEKALQDSRPNPPLSEDEMDRMLQMEQAALVAAIGRWSLPDEVNRTTLDNMSADVYDVLLKVAKPFADAIMANLRVQTEPKSLVPNESDPTGD